MEKIKIIDIVRHIRDVQYEMTKEKSREELKAYFKSEASSANSEARRLLSEKAGIKI